VGRFHIDRIGFAAACLAACALISPASAQISKKREKPHDTCTREYQPVCTRTREGVLTTFANKCLAQDAGAAILLNGRCDDDLKCPPIELSVCARKNGKNSTYTNSCVAEKQGAVVLMRDQCPNQCKPDGKPVCAVDANDKRTNYTSACEATLHGARVLHNGSCLSTSLCNRRGFRVCAYAANGVETQYASLCEAELANASWIHNGKCKPGVFRRMLQRYGIVKPR
jgi:hypothetical protein